MGVLEWLGYVHKKKIDQNLNKLQLIIQEKETERQNLLKEMNKIKNDFEKLKIKINNMSNMIVDLKNKNKNYLKIKSDLEKKITELQNENYKLRKNKIEDIRIDKIKAYIMYFIYKKYKWTGHSPKEEVVNRCRSDKITRDKSEVRKSIKELIDIGYLIRVKGGTKLNLNSNKKNEIHIFIKKHINEDIKL